MFRHVKGPTRRGPNVPLVKNGASNAGNMKKFLMSKNIMGTDLFIVEGLL